LRADESLFTGVADRTLRSGGADRSARTALTLRTLRSRRSGRSDNLALGDTSRRAEHRTIGRVSINVDRTDWARHRRGRRFAALVQPPLKNVGNPSIRTRGGDNCACSKHDEDDDRNDETHNSRRVPHELRLLMS